METVCSDDVPEDLSQSSVKKSFDTTNPGHGPVEENALQMFRESKAPGDFDLPNGSSGATDPCLNLSGSPKVSECSCNGVHTGKFSISSILDLHVNRPGCVPYHCSTTTTDVTNTTSTSSTSGIGYITLSHTAF